MKLVKVTISGFRSIKNSETLLVDDKVTVLIGANDHGKTNILNAIEFLNDDKPLGENDVNWDLGADADVIIEWHFEPSPEAQEKLAELEYSQPAEPTAEDAAIPPLLPTNDDNHVVFSRTRKENKVVVKSVPNKILAEKAVEVLKLRPRVELFIAPTTNLNDMVNREQLDKPEYEFMQGIFRLAGIWKYRDEIFTQNVKTSKLLDEASMTLTKILNSTWNQGRDLKWKLEHTGTNGDHIVIQIQDPAIESRYTRPSLRSSGFRTYFLLSMITYARTQKKTSDAYVYLFDEPGTYLHPQAQLDLQRSFETISTKSAIIYTTHSLFLINKNYPGRNRVVSKTKNGTKIDQKPFVKNWKAVRESLGILLSNNFLIAEKTLLVEGPSDVIYILHAMKKLKEREEVDVDLNDFSVVDAGTSENYVTMAKLMLSEGRDVVALVDGDKAGMQIEAQLKKICEKECKDKKLTMIKLPKDKSTEDVFANLITLQNAIKGVAEDYVALKVRTFQAGLDLAKAVLTVAPIDGETLGKIIENQTNAWFDPKEKMSKLSIALKYEDLVPPDVDVSEDAKTQIEKIKDKLSLKSEKNESRVIFEEVQ